MKNNKIIILLAAFLIMGFFVGRIISSKGDDDSDMQTSAVGTVEQQQLMHEQFPGLPENNRYIIESADQIMDRFESGTGIIFLGFKECPWCQKMAPILNEAAETGGATIYYLDIKTLRDNDPTTYQKLISSYLSPYLPKNDSGQPQISTPDISFVKNGEIIWRYEMDAITDAERTPDAYWTDARRERALQRFDDKIKELRS